MSAKRSRAGKPRVRKTDEPHAIDRVPMRPDAGDAEEAESETPADDHGIRCPDCGCRHFEVIETRPAWNQRIRRRRQCRNCGRRITTSERSLG